MHGTMRMSQQTGTRRLHRGMYMATAGIAFSLGLVLGILLPVRVFSASLDLASDKSLSSSGTWISATTERVHGLDPKPVAFISNHVTEGTNSAELLSQQEAPPSFVRSQATTNHLIDTSEFKRRKVPLATSRPDPNDPLQGIFWSVAIESLLPRGYGDEDENNWRNFVNQSVVVKMEDGCGRMQNRLITFDSGIRSCCRYRQNNDQIQGDIFSYYLGRLLNIGNLPPSTIAVVHGREWQWEPVRPYLHLAQWSNDRPVVMTQLLDNLQPAYIPPEFQNATRRLFPSDVKKKVSSHLVELAQWSDLIVFDYLTANLDRVVNNMYNEQWNAEMMHNPAHNLAKSRTTGLLVFLDNESGLLHGYRLLDKYEHFHASLLDSLCVFRYPTVRALEELHKNGNVAERLREMFDNSSVTKWLPFLPDRYLKILSERISRVYRQVASCHKRFGSGSYRWRTQR